jgi:hypothetical protein
MAVLHAVPAETELAEEQGPVTDTNVLKKDRLRFGIGTILYQSEETGLNPIYTVIVRALGGEALHLGIYGAAGSMGSLVQWVGTLLLRKFKSNRRAMICSMTMGLVIAALMAASILTSCIPALALFGLWAYLTLAWAFTGVSGVQMNIETAWIGDLVPTKRLAWFTSIKWFLSLVGIILFTFGFARMCDVWANRFTYATIYAIFAVSFVAAVFVYRATTDRVPKSASFVSSDPQSRLNYGSAALWCYILFSGLWTIGRQAQLAFTSAYLLV